MDIVKIEGLISAIESEGKNPAPHHANLARLVALICKALIEPEAIQETRTETLNPITPEIEEPAHKPTKKKKSSK